MCLNNLKKLGKYCDSHLNECHKLSQTTAQPTCTHIYLTSQTPQQLKPPSCGKTSVTTPDIHLLNSV